MRRAIFILACSLALGCVDKGPGPTHREIDPAYIEKNLLTEVPADIGHRIDGDFAGKVVYLGNDHDGETTLAPGAKVNIVHYWKVVEPPGSQWRVFAHLVGQKNTDWANIDYTDMRDGYGPGKWQAGDIIRDEQEFMIPDGWSSRTAKVTVGLYPKGQHSVSDRMEINSGTGDKERRLTVATLPVDLAKKTPVKRASTTKKPIYAINKVRGQITVDGRADEDDWKTANVSPVFLTAEGSPALLGDTRARMVWDDSNLYVFISIEDDDVYSQYTKNDDSLWKEDVVELFIDADRNRRGYVELQVNPNNTQLDVFFAKTRAAGKGDFSWSAGMQSAVTVHGTADNRNDTDTGWDVEIAIPLAAVKGTASDMRVTIPPRQGDIWRLNVVRIDKPKSQKNISVGSWNTITYSDFHALGRMLEVQFADVHGMVKPPSGKPHVGAPGAKKPGAEPGAQPGAKPGAGMPADHPAKLQPNQPGKPGSNPAAPLVPGEVKLKAAGKPGKPPAGKPPAGKPPVGKPPVGKPPAGKPPVGKPPVGKPPVAPK